MTTRLVVDRIACDGAGLCAHLAPDVIALDPWGYPDVVASMEEEDIDQVRRAVKGCPRRALHLVEQGNTTG